jgi:predicted amidohydrolase YtcJ
MKVLLGASLLFILSFSANTKQRADLLVYDATVYTVDSKFATAEAFVVTNGKIVDVGNSRDLLEKYDAKEKLNAE